MQIPQTHQLLLVQAHTSGAEEWRCATCGRHLLLRWQPAYEKQVLNAGDDRALHSAGRAAPLPRVPAGAARQSYSHEYHHSADMADIGGDWSAEGLRPWVRWFQQAGLDDLWNQPL